MLTFERWTYEMEAHSDGWLGSEPAQLGGKVFTIREIHGMSTYPDAWHWYVGLVWDENGRIRLAEIYPGDGFVVI